jgi:hypothetical protein
MTAKTARCHLCGRIVGRKSCRQEDSGWYCVQRALLVGVGVEIITPKPIPQPWKDDPALLAATKAEEQAQQTYDRADMEWMRTLRTLAEHRIQTADELRYTPTQGWGWAFKTTDHNQKKLTEAEATARQRRDDAGETLQAARVKYSAALAAAPRDYHTRQKLLPYAYNTACPRCGQIMTEDHALDLGRSIPLAIDPHSRLDRIQHVDCNHPAAPTHPTTDKPR